MEELRKELDRIDIEILKLLETRMQVCKELGKIKKAKSLPVYQPDQYRRHLEMLKEATQLDKAFVQQMYDVIHSEALKVQINNWGRSY